MPPKPETSQLVEKLFRRPSVRLSVRQHTYRDTSDAASVHFGPKITRIDILVTIVGVWVGCRYRSAAESQLEQLRQSGHRSPGVAGAHRWRCGSSPSLVAVAV